MGPQLIISKRIKYYRKLHALTQKELAAKIGVAPQYIANIEQGVKGISLDKLVELCKYFNISTSDILPMEENDDTESKEELINEIVDSLRTWEPGQISFLKAMICR